MPQPRNQIRNLHTRKLTTFAWLCALCDFDLKLFTVVEILSCHTKTTRSDLLDFSRWVVTICLRHEVCWIFATLAAVRLCTNAVHRNVQRLMRLGAKRAQRHARCYEAFADRRNAFDLFDRNCFTHRFDVEQITKMNWRVATHLCGILAPQFIAAAVTSSLHHMHALRFPRMRFTRTARLIKTTNRHHVIRLESLTVDCFSFALNPD